MPPAMDTPGQESFVTGKIRNMHLINFMTYEVINFAPKEYLNVILGPNGTGKSTLVSAILIGMGGDFQKIGRATHLKDYIKHGQENASIEITLYRNEQRDTITFTRKISINNKSIYLLNDRRVDANQYMAAVQKFNIQVDNLCQFLPQDRVQDFALMNPHEILKNTQKSVLPPEVSKQFDQLLEYETFSKTVHDKAARLEEQITSEEAANERLKPVVERMQQRNAITEKLNVANMKQKWLEKARIEEELATQQRDLQMAQSSIRERMAALVPIKEAAEQIVQVRTRDEKLIEERKKKQDMAKVQLRQMQNRANEAEKKVDDAVNAFQAKVQDIHTRREEEQRLQRELVKLEKTLSVAEANYAAESERSSLQGKQAEILANKRRRNELLEMRNEIGEQIDSQLKPKIIAMEHRLQNMRSVGDRRLENLRRFNQSLYEAVCWLRENKDDCGFRGRVYEPMLLELNVKNKEHIMYFESTISRNDLMAFTCEETSDTVTLHRLLNEQGLQCNVLHSASAKRVGYKPDRPLERIAHLGFFAHLLDLVDGPVPILNYICKMYNVHNIPVADESAMRNLSRIQQEITSPLIYVANKRMFAKRSVYSRDTVRGTDTINNKGWLTPGIDESLIVEQERHLDKCKREMDVLRNRRTELESELEYVDTKAQEWKRAEARIKAATEKVKLAKNSLTKVKSKITHLRSLPSSIEEEQVAHKRFLQDQLQRIIDSGKQQCLKLQDVMRLTQEVRVLQKKFQFRDREFSGLKRQLEAQKGRLDEAKNMYETVQKSVQDLQAEARSVATQFAQLAGVDSPQARNFRHKAVFNQLPNDLAELQNQIVLLRTQVECMNQDDETQFMQYENRKKLILELKQSLENHRERKTTVVRDMERLKVRWLPAIQAMVEEVNVNFQRFMSLIDVVGEVQLILNEENEFSKFGIGIRVKYRDNGPFLILDRYHHSGGERAVAIATYTLALQKISQVPFRCVDEINQGMDPDNERKVFNMLVDEAAQPGRAQYFFVSPKYQPDVKANRYTTFHIIDSGKYLADTDVFNTSTGSMIID